MTNPPAASSLPRRRPLMFAILVALALVVAGGGSETFAQTRRATVPAWLGIEVRPQPPRGKPLTICVGETRELLVRVTLTVVQLFGGGIGLTPLEPSVTNSSQATATVTRKESRPTNYGVAEPFQGARFDITGSKAGTGKLTFRATLPAGWGGGNAGYGYGPQPALHATTTLDYKVTQCDYEVSAVHRWTIPATLATATMAEVHVAADDQGRLSGSGQLEWVLRHRVPPCSSRDTVEPSGVDISGEVGDDGVATMRLAYQVASARSSVTCPAPCRGGCTQRSNYSIAPTEVAFSVPAGGGTTVMSQPIPGGFAGTVIITVEPVERSGVAWTGSSAATTPRRASGQDRVSVASAQVVDGPPAGDAAGSPPPDASPGPPATEVTLDLADGPFDLPDPSMGLADLPSYTSALTVSFEGTVAGAPLSATSSAVMRVSSAGRELTIDRGPTGPTSWYAEVGGTAYTKEGDGPCMAEAVREGGSFAAWFEPAMQLAPLVGADDAGSETVDGIPVHRYAFDDRAVVLPFIMGASGEVSVAAPDGHVVRYRLRVDAGPAYFGAEVTGSRTLDYELSVPREPLAIRLPTDCPPPVDAPLLPDATQISRRPGVLTFHSELGLSKAAKAYAKLLKAQRWKADGQPVVTRSTALLAFRKGKVDLTIVMRRASGSTTVQVMRTRS